MLNTDLKAQIDAAITNKTLPKSLSQGDVGNNMKAVVDYVDQETGVTHGSVLVNPVSFTVKERVIDYVNSGTTTITPDTVGAKLNATVTLRATGAGTILLSGFTKYGQDDVDLSTGVLNTIYLWYDGAFNYLVKRATVAIPSLSAPGSFSAAAASQTQINLSWAASANASGYTLERSLDGSTGWTSIYTGSALLYSDTGRTASTQYFYRIKATASGYSDSTYSTANATTSATPQLTAPTGLAVAVISNSQLNVSWNASANATNYILERSPDGANGWVQVFSGSGTSFNNTGLSSSTSYSYRVKAQASGYTDSAYRLS